MLEAYSVSHGKASAYLPVIEMLHELLRNRLRTTTAASAARRSIGKLLALDQSLEDTLPYLFVLLGIQEGDDPLAQMDLQIRRRRTLEAIKRIVLRESLNQPLIVMFEDLHWIDERNPGAARLARRLASPMRACCCWSTTAPSIATNGATRPTTCSCGSIRWAGESAERTALGAAR